MKIKNKQWLGFGERYEHDNILMVDIRPGVASKTEDVRQLSFENNTFEGIELHHVIEHMTEADADLALAECLRVLKPGGQLHISSPDLEACARTLLAGNLEVLMNIYSPHPEVAQQHKWGYTQRSMRTKLVKAGFKEIRQAAITEPHEFRFVAIKSS